MPGKWTVFDAEIVRIIRRHGPSTLYQIRPRIKIAFPRLCDDHDITQYEEPRWQHNLRARLEHMKGDGQLRHDGHGDPYALP